VPSAARCGGAKVLGRLREGAVDGKGVRRKVIWIKVMGRMDD
jgi:hypothetical protein